MEAWEDDPCGVRLDNRGHPEAPKAAAVARSRYALADVIDDVIALFNFAERGDQPALRVRVALCALRVAHAGPVALGLLDRLSEAARRALPALAEAAPRLDAIDLAVGVGGALAQAYAKAGLSRHTGARLEELREHAELLEAELAAILLRRRIEARGENIRRGAVAYHVWRAVEPAGQLRH